MQEPFFVFDKNIKNVPKKPTQTRMWIRSYRQTTLIPENFPGTATPLFHCFPYHFNIQILEWLYAFLSAPAPTTALWQRSAEWNLALSVLTAQERAREKHQRSQDTNPPAGDCLAGRRSTHRAQRAAHTALQLEPACGGAHPPLHMHHEGLLQPISNTPCSWNALHNKVVF